MINSSRSYKRERSYSPIGKFAVLVGIATIVGAVATVIATTQGLFKEHSSTEDHRGINRTATIPDGSDIPRNGGITVIEKNTTFALPLGQGVLLKSDRGGDTFALSELPSGRPGPGLIRVYVNGMEKDVAVGQPIATTDHGCFVWVVSEASIWEELTKTAQWRFGYHCNR